MGIPYCEVRRGTRPGARGPRGPSRLALGLGNEARERENPRGWDFPHPCNRWMQCGLACGCQSSKATGEAHARARLFLGEVQGGPAQMVSSLPSRVSAPDCKTSAENKGDLGSQVRKGKCSRGKTRG